MDGFGMPVGLRAQGLDFPQNVHVGQQEVPLRLGGRAFDRRQCFLELVAGKGENIDAMGSTESLEAVDQTAEFGRVGFGRKNQPLDMIDAGRQFLYSEPSWQSEAVACQRFRTVLRLAWRGVCCVCTPRLSRGRVPLKGIRIRNACSDASPAFRIAQTLDVPVQSSFADAEQLRGP